MVVMAPHLLLVAIMAVTSSAARRDSDKKQPEGRIKHVIVLMEENRSFDHFFGYARDEMGVNGVTGNEYNFLDTENPSLGKVYIKNHTEYINPCDPDHGTKATTSKIYGAAAVSKGDLSNATMNGFIEWELNNRHHNASLDYCGVMSMFTGDKIPVITTLAKEFAIMDRFFCDHPGPTWPNRMFALSGTSAGSLETGVWYHDQVGKLFPQKTIFDQVAEAGLQWRVYYNDTPWEAFMETIAHNPENIQSMQSFYEDASRGTLPSYAWINPRSGINVTTGVGSNDQHPDHDVAAGERFYKDIYEALRASPQWNETLFIITYDEHGGFYDHVPPPAANIPAPDDEKSYPTSEPSFDFTRLGVRVPTILISPWIKKGTVVSSPPPSQRPFGSSEYTLSSIISTARKLLKLDLPPLTRRDAWAATFEHVIDTEGQASPREDCPLHLPKAPPVTLPLEQEAKSPLNDLQRQIVEVHAHLAGRKMQELNISTQGEVSEWLRTHYSFHEQATLSWRNSKQNRSLDLVVRPGTDGWSDSGWDMVASEIWKDCSQVSTRSLKNEAGIPYCLDAGDARAGSQVFVSSCYPRDRAQLWLVQSREHGNDGTLRPVANDSLCLTTRYWTAGGDEKLYLERCKDDVEQKWAWHGPAPGSGEGSGNLLFGDDANRLGVVANPTI